jgi:hypothetical protein
MGLAKVPVRIKWYGRGLENPKSGEVRAIKYNQIPVFSAAIYYIKGIFSRHKPPSRHHGISDHHKALILTFELEVMFFNTLMCSFKSNQFVRALSIITHRNQFRAHFRVLKTIKETTCQKCNIYKDNLVILSHLKF